MAKETIAVLRESVKEKLLLEEQISNMTKRLEQADKLDQELLILVKTNFELELCVLDYEKINRENGIDCGPVALKLELNKLQRGFRGLICICLSLFLFLSNLKPIYVL